MNYLDQKTLGEIIRIACRNNQVNRRLRSAMSMTGIASDTQEYDQILPCEFILTI